ncbi:uncharacterized protein LOC122405299 isoform X1 [Colletes gigas]|uniref:uncharacterized protein LOC122405299 isoform X1 n=1 Tax=Colletes gigas TaxID=935657 RepID=UPI001C9B5469|nr:uncharacterized protein LOC122405299 isoform X1 [Colletes gigas]
MERVLEKSIKMEDNWVVVFYIRSSTVEQQRIDIDGVVERTNRVGHREVENVIRPLISFQLSSRTSTVFHVSRVLSTISHFLSLGVFRDEGFVGPGTGGGPLWTVVCTLRPRSAPNGRRFRALVIEWFVESKQHPSELAKLGRESSDHDQSLSRDDHRIRPEYREKRVLQHQCLATKRPIDDGLADRPISGAIFDLGQLWRRKTSKMAVIHGDISDPVRAK